MLIYNGQIIAGGGTIVLPMTRAEYEANKAILDNADVWVDLTDEPDQVATADQIAYSVDGVQKGMGYIGDIATKAVAKVEPTDTALYLHEVGEYFINKDGDACKVDLQIPVDGTITLGTNCHVLTKGVANDINSNLSGQDYVEIITSGQSYSSALDTLFSMINTNKIQPGKSCLRVNADIHPVVQLTPNSIIASHTYIYYNNKLVTDTYTLYANGSKFVNKTDNDVYDNSSTATTGTSLRFIY